VTDPKRTPNDGDRDPRDVAICRYLDDHAIAYERFDHPPVNTCDEADRLVPPAAVGVQTKNLFVRDKRGRRHVLVVTACSKSVDLRQTARLIGADTLSLGSPERLMTHLGVTPGAVTLLAIAHPGAASVELVLDADIWNGEPLRCHPMVNSATLILSHDAAKRFIETTGHTPKVIPLPVVVRADSTSRDDA
jgi:Ala-tRNA(Pro) deacylase